MQMNSSKSISIYLTSKDSECRLKNISEKEISVESNVELKTIRVNTHHPRQTILGFGGAFTEASASIYNQLDSNKKGEIIEAYFGESGNQYNMGRTHINSCDFS